MGGLPSLQGLLSSVGAGTPDWGRGGWGSPALPLGDPFLSLSSASVRGGAPGRPGHFPCEP